ncbi:hypothetical protein [Lentibacillus salicampi]|uniref:DUF4878 domain-containing protein n=1 Tax=Lentibacillus salicampi TaxID=175306 RepID=A0A4Y9AEB4_9BACI|nr:hypothetical protein [Lentibacillus salicampi]TFJ94228.1 hypothetical protein E4U82_02940 [Lentibacillus salicampi]
MRQIVLILVVVFAGAALFLLFHKSAEDEAADAVAAFYAYEQESDFSDSWEMFHPLMKEKFDKIDYIQDRSHVFMDHFGVTTFTYTIGETTEMKEWSIENNAEPIEVVYQVPVTQTFKGEYGNFSLMQNVYVTEIDDEWKILWDYKK